MRYLSTLLLITLISYFGYGQCNPPAALNCEHAPVLCSLNELNGYVCSNPDISNPTGPSPLCWGVGVPHNTIWWAFVGNGDSITVEFELVVDDCRDKLGLEAGIMDECKGGIIACDANCDSNIIKLVTLAENCHVYYIWLDGCNGDICNYNINIKNGEVSDFPDRNSKPYLSTRACKGSIAEVCFPKFDDGCFTANRWKVDGIALPKFDDADCIDLMIEDDSPIEVCVTLTIGDPDNNNAICQQEIRCSTFVPHDVLTIDEGDIFVCWEDHQGNGYLWHDTLILDPDCNGNYLQRTVVEKNGCTSIYRACVHLLASKPIGEKYVFICGQDDLPYITENGKKWYKEACGEKITWQDSNSYDCDTTYLLYLSIFKPMVTLTQDCGDCDGEISIKAEIDYNPNCLSGNITYSGFWLNSNLDTIGVGNELNDVENGLYYFVIHLNYQNPSNNNSQNCILTSSPLWEIMVQDVRLPTPNIIGMTSICKNQIGNYRINTRYTDACSYNWYIKTGNGTILTPNFSDSSKIDINWVSDTDAFGEICVYVKNDCDISDESCFRIDIVDAPNFSNLQFECSDDWTAFRMNFQIIGGDSLCTEVNDGMGWTGLHGGDRTYQTPWYNNNQKVLLQTFDQYQCQINTIDTTYDCMTVSVNNVQHLIWDSSPNPAYDYLRIKGNIAFDKLDDFNLQIFDINGQKRVAHIKSINDHGILLNVEYLPSGMYIIQFENGNNKGVMKFVKL